MANWIQFLLGTLLSFAATAVILLLGNHGVPLGKFFWLGVFAAFWAILFVCMKRNQYAFVTGVAFGGTAVYLAQHFWLRG